MCCCAPVLPPGGPPAAGGTEHSPDLSLLTDNVERLGEIKMAVITSSDVVKNALAGPEMVKAVDVIKQWSPAVFPFLHTLHSQLCGTSNDAVPVPEHIVTNR